MKNKKTQRILSMIVDSLILLIVIFPYMILLSTLESLLKININDSIIGLILILLPFFIFLNKDFFNAKSLAKRLLGFQVVSLETNKPATELQCFVRNLTVCVVLPLEIVVGFINPERRIGDFIANTKVIPAEKEPTKSIWNDFKNTTWKLNYIGILIIGIAFFGLLGLLMRPGLYLN